MEAPDNAYAVILAGGGGTRLWPKSRSKHPKHLLTLFGKESLIRLTYDRIKDIFPKDRIYVITLGDHLDLIKKQLPELSRENIIIEPKAKNTALAMGTAAAFIHAKNPNAALIYLAADQVFKKVERFQQNAIGALRVALSGDYIVAIGIRPSFPHTGLGYIKIGDQLEDLSNISQKGFVFKGKGFKEKPNLVTAQAFLASGQYLWNANIYSWSTQTILKAFEKYSPKIAQAFKEVVENLQKAKDQKFLEKIYEEVGEVDSIDYEVSERTNNIVVIPGDFGWSDIGDWKVVYDILEKDEAGNAVTDLNGNVINIGTKNSLIEANGRLIAVVGLENIVVVDTDDAILIVDKNRTQDVKKAVEKLKELKKDKYL